MVPVFLRQLFLVLMDRLYAFALDNLLDSEQLLGIFELVCSEPFLILVGMYILITMIE